MRSISTLLLVLLFIPGAFANAFDVLDPGSEYDGYCPQLSLAMGRGATDAYYYGQVTGLQKFLAGYFEVSAAELVSGTFGDATELYVKRFQAENGLEAAGRVGTQTLQKIWMLCPLTDESLPTSPNIPAPAPRVSNGSCVITSDVKSADEGKRFVVSWKISGMDAPVLWRQGSEAKAVAVPAEAWKQWLVGADVPSPGPAPRIERFSIGEKTAPGVPLTPVCSVSVTIALDRVYVASSPTMMQRAGGIAPSLILSITPATVPLGEAASLKWTVANAPATSTRCFLEYKDKKLELRSAGGRTIRPTENTSYKMTCLNTVNGLNVTRTAHVTVGPPRPRPVVPTTPTVGGGGGYEGGFFGGSGLGGGFGGFSSWMFNGIQNVMGVFGDLGNTCLSINGCGSSRE